MAHQASVHEPDELRIQLLGGFKISIGPRLIEEAAWRLRKARSLIKLLALAPHHRLHRDQVLDQLWPDLAFETQAANNNLHRALHLARRALEPTRAPASPSVYLSLRDDILVLCPSAPLWIDVDAFEATCAHARQTRDPAAFEAALALHRGELLPEDRYEDWVIRRREAVHEQYVALLAELAQVYARRTEPDRAIEVLQRIVATDPALEEAHVGLMRLYAFTGQHHQALRQFEQLRRELDTEPDEATQRLYLDIESGRFPANLPGVGEIAANRDERIPSPDLRDSGPSGVTNLPDQLTSFVGREREVDEVKRLLSTSRLVTLTGAGGCGKTRLALRVATELAHLFPDGVWLAQLDALSDPHLVPTAVAAVMRVEEESDRPLTETLALVLQTKRMLLILDNCEHLIAACAQLAEVLLRACPHVHVLATSRQALAIVGETAWCVPSLDIPDPVHSPSFERLLEYGAVQLFVTRARESRPGFAPTPDMSMAIGQICRRLDGIPLAIELAAARVSMLSVGQIVSRLDDAMPLLSTYRQMRSRRQQTLTATVDWSYALLSDLEQALFRRLSMFAGGWTLEAAETVCVGAGIEPRHVLDLMEQLVEKSLVVVTNWGEPVRYRLLEPIQQYAANKLRDSDEVDHLSSRHADWCLTLAEKAASELTGPDQSQWLDTLEREHDNLRRALAWAVRERRIEICMRFGASLGGFWTAHGHLSEGYRQLETMLAIEPQTTDAGQPAQAQALAWAGLLAWQLGRYERATIRSEAALALCQTCNDARSAAGVLNTLASLAQGRGQHERAEALAEQSLALQRDLDDKPGMAATLKTLATMVQDRGEYTHAAALYQQSLALSREIGDRRGIAVALNNLGTVADGQGDHAYAATLIQEGLSLFRALGERRATAVALCDLAEALRHQGRYEDASALLDEALPQLRALGDRLNTALALMYQGVAALGVGAVDRAQALGEEGLALSRELNDNRLIVYGLTYLARVALRQGHLTRAEALACEAVGRYRSSGDRLRRAPSLEVFAYVAQARHRPERAARLLGAAEVLREAIGMPVPAAERAEHERHVGAIRMAVGSKLFGQAWAAGRALTAEQAVAEVLVDERAFSPSAFAAEVAAEKRMDALTPREREVALLVAAGRTNREIAAMLHIAERTADTHMDHILTKLRLTSRHQVADWIRGQMPRADAPAVETRAGVSADASGGPAATGSADAD